MVNYRSTHTRRHAYTKTNLQEVYYANKEQRKISIMQIINYISKNIKTFVFDIKIKYIFVSINFP